MKIDFVSDLEDLSVSFYLKNGKWDGLRWRLNTPLCFIFRHRLIQVPVGFVTDFGSIPKAFRSILSRSGKSLRAFIIHDYLYSKGVMDHIKQRDCDEILYQLSIKDGESSWKAYLINKGLLAGGWYNFNKKEAIIA